MTKHAIIKNMILVLAVAIAIPAAFAQETGRSRRAGPPNRERFTPEQREARQKQMIERLDERIAALEQKAKEGALSDQEQTQLKRAKDMKAFMILRNKKDEGKELTEREQKRLSDLEKQLRDMRRPFAGPPEGAPAERPPGAPPRMFERLNEQIAALEQKAKDGTLTDQEEIQLKRAKDMKLFIELRQKQASGQLTDQEEQQLKELQESRGGFGGRRGPPPPVRQRQ